MTWKWKWKVYGAYTHTRIYADMSGCCWQEVGGYRVTFKLIILHFIKGNVFVLKKIKKNPIFNCSYLNQVMTDDGRYISFAVSGLEEVNSLLYERVKTFRFAFSPRSLLWSKTATKFWIISFEYLFWLRNISSYCKILLLRQDKFDIPVPHPCRPLYDFFAKF